MLPTIVGVCRYEFRMQARRPAVWLLIGIIGVLLVALFDFQAQGGEPRPAIVRLADQMQNLNFFLPIAFGILLADRLPRERRLHTEELLQSLPSGSGVRLWGKYAGAVLATTVPIVLVVIAGLLITVLRLNAASQLPALPPLFLAIMLPGLLFVGVFAIACTTFLPAALFSVLFVGYWFWGNLVPPGIMPTLSCTPLTPLGGYAAAAFFNDGPVCGMQITAAQGWESIGLLLGTALLALVAANLWLQRHQRAG